MAEESSSSSSVLLTHSTSHSKPITYGSPSSSSPNDSGIGVSPVSPEPSFHPRPLLYTYSHPNGHRIIPPSISGHGRLIVAHRTVPYWGGVLVVIGSFAWAVFVAMHVFELLGAKHPSTRPRYGECKGWFC